MKAPFLALGIGALMLASAGCGPHPDRDGEIPPSPTATPAQTDPTDPFADLPTGDEQLQNLCAKGFGDPVATAFCAPQPPTVNSVTDLLGLVGLSFQPGVTDNGANGNPAYVLNVHSTGLSTRYVSELNPRAFVFTPPLGNPLQQGGTPQPNNEFVVVSTVRGESFIELIAKDATAGGVLRFYLLVTEHGCESRPTGCSYGEMLTEAWESGITGYTLYDGETIANTVFDCMQCHQPDGPGTPAVLRMQERKAYWTHWMFPETLEAQATEATFLNMHDQESYGGIPWANMVNVNRGAPRLEALVEHNGFMTQPNEYDSIAIDQQVFQTGTSPIWDGIYAEAVAGRAIAVPYFAHSVADPAKVASMTSAYADVKNGTLTLAALPDIRDVHDDALKPFMSLQPAPGLTGREILAHSCQHCHNSKLDPSLSRANFNVETLDALSRETKDEAIRRLTLPDTYAQKMPPPRFHTLSTAELNLVITELSQ